VSGWIGAEVERAVLLNPSNDFQAREGLPNVQAQGGIILVVSENDVVAGSEFLNVAGFEEQGLLLGDGDGKFQGHGLGQQCSSFDIFRRGTAEIAAHPLLQVPGFSHVQDRPHPVLETIHAGEMRQCLDGLRERLFPRCGEEKTLFVHELPRNCGCFCVQVWVSMHLQPGSYHIGK